MLPKQELLSKEKNYMLQISFWGIYRWGYRMKLIRNIRENIGKNKLRTEEFWKYRTYRQFEISGENGDICNTEIPTMEDLQVAVTYQCKNNVT
jgi:hypothetical protein